MARSRDTVEYLGVNPNSSKITKVTDLQFGTHALKDSPDVTPKMFFFQK